MGTARFQLSRAEHEPYGKKGKGKGGAGRRVIGRGRGFFMCFKLPLAAHMGVEAAEEGGGRS